MILCVNVNPGLCEKTSKSAILCGNVILSLKCIRGKTGRSPGREARSRASGTTHSAEQQFQHNSREQLTATLPQPCTCSSGRCNRATHAHVLQLRNRAQRESILRSFRPRAFRSSRQMSPAKCVVRAASAPFISGRTRVAVGRRGAYDVPNRAARCVVRERLEIMGRRGSGTFDYLN